MHYIESTIIYFVFFALSLYALHAVDFEKFMKKGRVMQIQTLYLLLSMALAYILGRFLMEIMYFSTNWY